MLGIKKHLKIDEALGSFVKLNEEEINKINRYKNKEVAKLCYKKFKDFSTPFPEMEIFVNEQQKWRYEIHDKIVKKFILNSFLKKKKKFDEILLSSIKGARRIINVSCGDSKLIFNLYDKLKPDFAVANDISWSQLDGLRKEEGRRVLLTNHNAAYLPFVKNSFDIAYCGNTLHHLISKQELAKVFESLFKISKKIVFVEIEKPSDIGLLPNLLNKYWYIGFLKDAGGAYLSKEDFHSIISGHFKDKADVVFSEFKNIQGRYMIAEITKNDFKNHVLEVEEKFYIKDLEKLIKKLSQNQFIENTETEHERDIYFSDVDGEFIKNRTCLRFREIKDNLEITYKGKSHSFGNGYAKVEKNIKIHNNQKKDFEELFKSLRYVLYSVVDKERKGWSLLKGEMKNNIFIDTVKGCGSFVEIETISDENHKNQKEVRDENQRIISLFEDCLGDKATMPYRDFVADYIYKKQIIGDKTKMVLLDFDGTLVPTEEIFFDAYNKISIEIFGESLSFDEYKDKEISNDASLFGYLSKKYREVKISEKDFMEKVYDEYRVAIEKIFEHEETLIHLNLIDKLKSKGIKFGIVSSSKREFIDKILNHFEKQNLFDFVIAREDVVNRKQDSEPYDLAFKKQDFKKKIF